MGDFTPKLKHLILQQYGRPPLGRSFGALAQLYHVKGGKETVRQWWLRWDGTPQSLERKAGSGRPRTLSASEVSRHIRAPLLAANRAHRAIHYSTLLPSVRLRTGTQLSARTLRRIGKEQLAGKNKRSKKRTVGESE
jgi:transposase